MSQSAASMSARTPTSTVALIPMGIALNLAIGFVVSSLKLPVFLDAIGTIIVTLIGGLWAGLATGVLSFLLGGLLTNPVLPWFVGTQAAIALVVHIAAKRGGFKSVPRTVLVGVVLGVVAGIVSAPVIVYLFGGVTGSGSSLVTSYLLATGQGMVNSVILSGLASEPIDKALQCVLALWLVRGVPNSILRRFEGGTLEQNDLVKTVPTATTAS